MSKLELVNTTAFYLSAADRQHPDVDCGLVSFCCVKHEQRCEHNRVPFDMHLLLPLLAAIFFAIGSMVSKRAYYEGARVVHVVLVNNGLLAILFLPPLSV